MVNLIINGQNISVKEGTTILEAAKKVGVNVPTLCYLKEVNEISACRICVVEVEGLDKLVPACSTKVTEGMVVKTNSHRVIETRNTNLRLILSQHNGDCTLCKRNGNCTLQTLAMESNLVTNPFKKDFAPMDWDENAVLIRDESKCIKCMRCINVCEKIQSLGIWDVKNTGSRTTVGVSRDRAFGDADCSLCGQCITHCPVGALTERDDTAKVYRALADENKVTVVQVAPAVRAGWAEELGLPTGSDTTGKMVAALKKIGFNYVFDTNFTADLTIMEEGSEFIERFTHKDKYKWPMFTSCCPGWVRFLKSQYPDMTPNLSTAKSPQQMFGAVAKSYFAEKIGVDPHNIFVVSVMPCTAKKSECAESNQNDACGDPDVDVSITTREFVRMIKASHVDAASLKDTPFDSILGEGTGAAVIFGATGGVMDAALRSAYYLVTGKNPDADAFKQVRGLDGWKEATFNIKGAGDVKVAVASGLGNTRKLVEAIRNGEVSYDFVEIMACPGGCAGGGGQPIHDGKELAGYRGDLLWKIDKNAKVRFSHENTEVQTLYKDYMGKPLSEKSHHLLHTNHDGWTMPLSDKLK